MTCSPENAVSPARRLPRAAPRGTMAPYMRPATGRVTPNRSSSRGGEKTSEKGLLPPAPPPSPAQLGGRVNPVSDAGRAPQSPLRRRGHGRAAAVPPGDPALAAQRQKRGPQRALKPAPKRGHCVSNGLSDLNTELPQHPPPRRGITINTRKTGTKQKEDALGPCGPLAAHGRARAKQSPVPVRATRTGTGRSPGGCSPAADSDKGGGPCQVPAVPRVLTASPTPSACSDTRTQKSLESAGLRSGGSRPGCPAGPLLATA